MQSSRRTGALSSCRTRSGRRDRGVGEAANPAIPVSRKPPESGARGYGFLLMREDRAAASVRGGKGVILIKRQMLSPHSDLALRLVAIALMLAGVVVIF